VRQKAGAAYIATSFVYLEVMGGLNVAFQNLEPLQMVSKCQVNLDYLLQSVTAWRGEEQMSQ
jgi:hypothetical protein